MPDAIEAPQRSPVVDLATGKIVAPWLEYLSAVAAQGLLALTTAEDAAEAAAAAGDASDEDTPTTGYPLTGVSDTNVTVSLAGMPAIALLQPVTVTLGWSGVLSPLRGGTGLDTSGSTGVAQVAAGTWSVTTTLQAAVQDNITRTGALNSGSITSGFGSIDIGTDSFTGNNLNLTGLITSTGGGTNTFSAAVTGAQVISLRNTAAGTGNYVRFGLGNDQSTERFNVTGFSSTYTPSGPNLADGMFVGSGGVGGLSLYAAASADVRIYSRATLAATFGASQALTLTGVLTNTASGGHSFTGTANNVLNVGNSTAGTANFARFALTNDLGQRGFFTLLSSTFTTSTFNVADGVAFISSGDGGMSLGTANASGATRVYSGNGLLALTIGSTQTATFTGAVVAPRFNANGTLASGTYNFDVLGAAGADRTILRVGVLTVTNGFTVSYSNTSGLMNYSFITGNVSIGGAATPTTGTNTLLITDGTAPTGMVVNNAGLFANDVGGTTHLFAISEADVTIQLTGAATNTLATAVQDNITRLGTLTNGPGGFTAGSVVFHNGTTLAQDNANLFWNDTSNRLGIGTSASPSHTLHVVTGATTATGSLFSADGLTTGNTLKVTGSTATPGTTSSFGVDSHGTVHLEGNIGNTQGSDSDGATGKVALFYSKATLNSSTAFSGSYNALLVSNVTGSAAQTAVGLYSYMVDNTTKANTVMALDAQVTVSVGGGAKNIYGVASTPLISTSADVTGMTVTGLLSQPNVQNGTNTGTVTVVGFDFAPTVVVGGAGGSSALSYGARILPVLQVGAGTATSYGVYIGNATMDTVGTTTQCGLYIESVSGADTNWAAYLAGGPSYIGGSLIFGDSSLPTLPSNTAAVYGDSDSAGMANVYAANESSETARVSPGGIPIPRGYEPGSFVVYADQYIITLDRTTLNGTESATMHGTSVWKAIN